MLRPHAIKIATLIGNSLEFYDLGLFGFLAPIITPLFFPSDDPFITLLLSMGVFAGGYLMRPLGGIIFGYISDTQGRKTSLTATLLLMAAPTFLIGVLPDYHTIGFIAPLFLIVLRLTQGLCTGGEYNNSAIFLLEQVPKYKQGFYSGCMTASSILGFLLSSITAHLCTLESMPSWGWRLPFLGGSLIGLLGLYLRRKVIPDNMHSKTPQKLLPSFGTLLTKNPIELLMMIAIGGYAGTLSLSFMGFLYTYLTHINQFSTIEIKMVTYLGLFIYLLGLPIAGYFADRFGSWRLMIVSTVLTCFSAYTIFWSLNSNNIWNVAMAISFLAVLTALFLGPMHALMITLFPQERKVMGVSFGFSVGVALLGSTAPFFSTLLTRYFTFAQGPAIYFSAVGLLCFGVLLTIRLRFYYTQPIRSLPSS